MAEVIKDTIKDTIIDKQDKIPIRGPALIMARSVLEAPELMLPTLYSTAKKKGKQQHKSKACSEVDQTW